MTSVELNILLLILAFLLLAVGAGQDLKTREVADWIWIFMIGGGIIIHLMQFLLLNLNNSEILFMFWIPGSNIVFSISEIAVKYLTTWIINFLLALTISISFAFLGLLGEADIIAFNAIAIITPVSKPILFSDPIYDLIHEIVPRFFGTFCNAYVLSIFVPLLLCCYNFINQRVNPKFYVISNESWWKRLILRFIGFPRHTQNLEKELKLKTWHFDFLEEYEEEKGWRLAIRIGLDTPESDLTRKENLIALIKTKKKEFIWVQPSLPFIFILMLGYFTEIFLGNLLFIAMIFLL
jgi:hypothetical protein